MSDPMLVTLTTAQLRALVRDAVVDALGELESLGANRAPSLLDRSGLAKALGCSVGHVDRLCHKGLPNVRLGEVRRFEFARVLGWLTEGADAQSEGQRPESAEKRANSACVGRI